MTDQQVYLLKLLLEIDDICTRHGIEYLLASGTLIGAVRHGGFIPWDDDADIYMTRENWECFRTACETDLPKDRKLEVTTDPAYTNTFPRYTSTETTAIHSHQSLNDSFVGVPIDIFILEPIKRDEEAIRGYTYDLMLYSDLVNYSAVFGRRFGVSAEDYEKCRELEQEKGAAYVRELFEEKLDSHLSADGDIYILRWGGNPMLFEREWFDSTVRVPFEGHQLMAGVGIDEFLTAHYGDEWYQVPLVHEHSAHDMAGSLLIRPEEARELALVDNRDELKEQLSRRKVSLLRSAAEDYALGRRVLESEAVLIARDTMSRYEELSGSLSEEFRPDEAQTYEYIFGRYLAWQLSARAAGRDDWSGVHRMNDPVVAKLSDEADHALVRYLFNTERVAKASRFIDMLEQTGHELDDFEADVRACILKLREARAHIQYGRAEEGYRAVAEVLREFPCNESALKVGISALLHVGSASRGEAQDLCRHARALYPEDGDFIFYEERLARMAVGGEAVAGSRGLLEEAILSTRNGMVLHELADDETCDEVMRGQLEAALSGEELAPTERRSAFDEEVAERYRGIQREILRLCKEADVHVFINPVQAQSALEGTDFSATDGDAYTLYAIGEDMLKLQGYLDAHPERLPGWLGFEGMATNPRYPSFTMRFSDQRTTDLSSNMSATYRYAGMFVCLQAFKPRRFRRLIRGARKLWRRRCLTWYGAHEPIKNVERREKRGRKLFTYTMRNCSKERTWQRVDLCEHSLTYESALFERTRPVEVAGVECFVPEDMEAYWAPVQEVLDAGGSFNHQRWFLSPRIAVSDEDREAYEQARLAQSDRGRAHVEDRRIRKRFVRSFNRQKRVIAEEDERRRGEDEGRRARPSGEE